MSFFHKKNVIKCLGHHYAIWTSDSNFLLAQTNFFGPALISGTATGSKSVSLMTKTSKMVKRKLAKI